MLNTVSFILLARLLMPQQLGLYSVALAIFSVMQAIREFGLVNFLIPRESLAMRPALFQVSARLRRMKRQQHGGLKST